MKRLAFFIFLVMGGLLSIAQNGSIDLRNESKAEITKSDFQTLRAVFSYGSLESVEISTEKGVFSQITLQGTYPSGEVGTPELPATHEMLAVPFGATPTVSVVSYTSKDYNLSDYGINTILPHQPSVRKDQKPEDIKFIYDEKSYQTRALASAPEATIEVLGTMRGIRIGSLLVNPVSYNAKDNTIRVFNDIEVEVRFDGADLAETERMLVNTYSPYFDIVYKQLFNNRQILDVYTDHPDLMAYPVHMIVIAPQNYLSALEPWTNWKIQKGFDVSIYTTQQAGSTYNSIRNFVKNLYNTGVSQGATPTFLVLVGDTGQIPGTTGNQTTKVTDLYYGSVDSDYFPDMFYSRMSAENTTQLTNIVNKILQYEQYTMPDPSYLSKATLIAGWDDYWNPRVGVPTVNYAKTNYYNAAHGFTTVNTHVNQSQYSGCYNSLSTGVGFVNYTAHGDNTMWYQPQLTNSGVNQLTNTNKYFLAMGNCCLSGNFGYSQTCFGEAMIRAQNKAAFSFIGSCPETYWYEDYYFGVGATNTYGSTPNINNTTTGVYDGVWMDDTYNTVSSMVFLGNLSVCYAYTGNYSNSSSSGCSPTYYWQAYHVLGDGSIMPYRVNPTANNVRHANNIPEGATSFTVNAQAGSYVGISQNNVLKGAAFVPASGTVDVPISGISSGQVKIVVTKPQRRPYIQEISAAGGGGGALTYAITATPNPAEGGFVSFAGKNGITYGFEGNMNGWSVLDSDGDGYTWEMLYNNDDITCHTGEGMVFSASYDNNIGALTPDNFLISPRGQYSSISFWACAQDNAYPEEHFGVGVSTDSGLTMLQEWTISAKTQGNWYQYTVDLSEYEDQDVYVAIRHFNCSDMNRLNVDDITLMTYEGGGTSTPGTPVSGTFIEGYQCTVTVIPNSDYSFVNWTENGSVVSTSQNYTFTVKGNRNLVANMELITKPKANIYPNPVGDNLVVMSEKKIDRLIIYDLTGTMVFNLDCNSDKVKIGISELQNGVYYLEVIMDALVETKKIIKM